MDGQPGKKQPPMSWRESKNADDSKQGKTQNSTKHGCVSNPRAFVWTEREVGTFAVDINLVDVQAYKS